MIIDITCALFGWHSTTTGVNYCTYGPSITSRRNTIEINGIYSTFNENTKFYSNNDYKIEYLPHCKYGISAIQITEFDPIQNKMVSTYKVIQ